MCKDCKTGKIKFSFMEMISSGCDGTTSATGFIGITLCLVCMLMAVSIFFFYFFNTGEAEHTLEFLDKVIVMLGIGSALLGTRKITGVIGHLKNSQNATVIQGVEEAVAGDNSNANNNSKQPQNTPRRQTYNAANPEEPIID